MGFNWPKMATIVLKVSITSEQNIIDIFEVPIIEIFNIFKYPDPCKVSFQYLYVFPMYRSKISKGGHFWPG